MAQLRRSVMDGHLFILAGQSQGTWQVGEKGEQWLRQNCYTIPDKEKHVEIDAGTFSYLKDKEYLYTLGIDYDRNSMDISLEAEQALARVIKGLPMLLVLKEKQEGDWELYLELTELHEDVWEELRSHQTEQIVATNALAVSRRQIFYNHDGLLQIYPFPGVYEIYSTKGDNSKRRLQKAPETLGLNENWQGNIFLERVSQIGRWQRRLPGTSIAFSGELLWLARTECNPDWPGLVTKVGSAKYGWQLWHLAVSEVVPTSWGSIENWFKYRSIDVVPLRQRFEIVSPPSLVTEDGYYAIEPGKSLWYACYPPNKQTQGLLREIALSAEKVAYTTSNANPLSKCNSASHPADRTNYFRWVADQPGDYRIRIQGDASVEPLQVKVAPIPSTQPTWLCGLWCTVKIDADQQTMHAFQESQPDDASYIGDRLIQKEPARLEWTYEPTGFPISITWFTVSPGGQQRLSNISYAQSDAELTQYWKQHIFPALSLETQVKVVLDGGSFGSIAVIIALPEEQKNEVTLPDDGPIEATFQEKADTEGVEKQVQVESTLEIDEQLIAQFAWLRRMTTVKYGQKSLLTSMPVSLRNKMLVLSSQQGMTPPFRAVLGELASTYQLPVWVLFRLQALIAEIEGTGEYAHRYP